MKKLFFSLVILAMFFLGVPTHASAMEVRKGDTVRVSSEEQIEGSALLVSEDVTVDGIINGDLYCAGKHVRITGQVFGDVICAGQFVEISGSVDGSVRVAAQELIVNSDVMRNVTVVGQSVTIAAESYVAGEVFVAGQEIQLSGEIQDDVVAYGNILSVGGTVGGDTHLNGNRLTIKSSSALLGSTNYRGPVAATIEEGASLSGAINYTQTKEMSENRGSKPRMLNGPGIGGVLFPMITMGIAAFVLHKLFPGFMQRVDETLRKSPLHAGLYGLLVVIGGPIALVLLCLTLVGIPLAFIAFLFWIILAMLAHTFTVFSIGYWILAQIKQDQTPVKAVLAGAVVLSILNALPIIGFFSTMFSFFVGIGAASKTLLSYRKLNS